jgi:drug/metabolite transporter (DMT)-like permease
MRPEIANTFFATTPLWGVVLAHFKGEEMKKYILLGTAMAFSGVAILILFN